ncbi:MAG: hypothetical protein Q7S21_02720 [archaeon]|nr:hypothetical protein [archaeon]
MPTKIRRIGASQRLERIRKISAKHPKLKLWNVKLQEALVKIRSKPPKKRTLQSMKKWNEKLLNQYRKWLKSVDASNANLRALKALNQSHMSLETSIHVEESINEGKRLRSEIVEHIKSLEQEIRTITFVEKYDLPNLRFLSREKMRKKLK